jgi:hypothetical protein
MARSVCLLAVLLLLNSCASTPQPRWESVLEVCEVPDVSLFDPGRWRRSPWLLVDK